MDKSSQISGGHAWQEPPSPAHQAPPLRPGAPGKSARQRPRPSLRRRPSARAGADRLCSGSALTGLGGGFHPHWVGPGAPGPMEGGAVEPGAQLYTVAGARAQL